MADVSLPPLGINLWQFHRTHDQPQGMSAAAASGYRAVETFGPVADAKALRVHLDHLGLVCAARHLTLAELDALEREAEIVHALGANDICSSGLYSWNQRSAQDYIDSARRLNQAGAALRAHGIHLHYHNHEFEFLAMDGARTGMDLLLEHGDPAAWDFCIDVGWVQQGGVDPVAFLREHRERIRFIHLRDFSAANVSTTIGAGAMDLPAIVEELRTMPRLRWAMVEQEPGVDPSGDARSSRQFLQSRFSW
jgi:sugar phosphate isomerase/epimerase